jgi:hypothetical protein
MLAHVHDDCTGSWRLRQNLIVCSVCGRAHPATPRNRIAAMDENYAGSMLRRAAQRGSILLARERPRG